MKQSPEQIAAINTLGKNILLSASAGAGKTTVLVARLMKRIIEDGVNVDEILAMTFTDLAATEMKKRLAKQLQIAYKASHDERIYRQIALLASARISTIHAFCLGLVKDYAYVLGISQKRANSITDEATSSIYKNQALDLTLNEAYLKAEPNYLQLLRLLHHRPEEDANLRLIILDLHGKLEAKLDPETWLTSIKKAYRHYDDLGQLDEPFRSAFFSTLMDGFLQLKQSFDAYQHALSFDQINDEASFHTQFIQNELTQAQMALTQLQYTNYLEHLHKLANRQAKTIRGLETETKRQRDAYYDHLKDLVVRLFDEKTYLSDIEMLEKPLATLFDLVIAFGKHYQTIKENAEVLDFSDMEKMALSILKNKEFKVADQLRSRIKDILVDEFQDSNEVQDELVLSISRGDNIFRVGDVKQSIYRFRNARPQLMSRLMQSQDPNDLTLYLSNNFRSKESIVNFNNQLFSNLMNIEGLESHYSEKDHVKIGKPDQEGGSSIELHLIEDLVEEDEESIKADRIKANHIAQTILKCHTDQSFPHWKDAVVLVKSHRAKLELKKAFDHFNIPNFIDVKAGFYLSSSVQDVLQVLRFCLDTSDELAFVGVLLSQFFGYDENFLAKLRIEAPYSLLDGFKTQEPEAYQALMNLVNASTQSLSSFLNALYQFNAYYDTKIDTQQRTNLDLLRMKAQALDEENFSLIEFIQMVEVIQDEKTSEAIPVSQEDDVVKVLTIHQSKGLEWPLVFVLGTKQFKDMSNNGRVHYDNDIGIGMDTILLPERFRRDNPMTLAIKHKTLKEEKEEALRVWYVALTRAEQKLIIVDRHHKNLEEENLDLNLILGSRGYTFLTMAAAKSMGQGFEVKLIAADTIEDRYHVRKEAQGAFHYIKRDEPTLSYKRPSSHARVNVPKVLELENFNDGKERGTRLHHLIENLPRNDWTSEMILELDPACTLDEVEALMAFYHSSWYEQMRTMHVYKEFPFIHRNENEVLRGIFDIFAVDENDVYCVDFKTDRHLNEIELLAMYQSQLEAYQAVLRTVYPKHTHHAGLYSFKHQKIIELKSE